MNMNDYINSTNNTFSYATSAGSANTYGYVAPPISIKISEGEYCDFLSDIKKSSNLVDITDYKLNLIIKDINVYGDPDPRVVEVEFEDKCNRESFKVKAVCDEEDAFDLERGVFIAMVKCLYGKSLTPEGIEEKAHELSLYTENCKKVSKAIKEYHKKIKSLEAEKKRIEEQKKAKLRRKEKNHLRRQRVKERKQKELIKLIDEVVKNQ